MVQYHDTVTSEHVIRTFATVTTPVLGVLENTLQYHDIVNFVQDSETEDPHFRDHLPRVIRLIAGFVQRCDTEKPTGLLSMLNLALFHYSVSH